MEFRELVLEIEVMPRRLLRGCATKASSLSQGWSTAARVCTMLLC
jgi:hypothetical protein